jgi:hypothetical protein
VAVAMNLCKVAPIPTVSYFIHSTMIQLAISDRMHVCSIDTVTAFLHQ